MRDRRSFLKALAVGGTTTMLRGVGVFGQQTVNKVNVRGGAIDVHHHFLPPGQSAGARRWTPQASLDEMEKFGIAVAILSMTQNGDLLYDGTAIATARSHFKNIIYSAGNGGTGATPDYFYYVSGILDHNGNLGDLTAYFDDISYQSMSMQDCFGWGSGCPF